MTSSPIFQTRADFHFDINNCPKQNLPKNVLMVSPEHFTVEHAINVHMLDANGQPNTVDKIKATKQWNELKDVYEKIGFKVHVVCGGEGLPDMVFCANQSFPYTIGTEKHVILSNMRDDTRHKEVPLIEKFFVSLGYQTHSLTPRAKNTLLEGMGDVGWLGQKRFLLCGYGFRTDKQIYQKLSDLCQIPMALFELKNPKFYHLDTCLSVLNSQTALVCKDAFTPEGFELLQSIFPQLLLVSPEEADSPGFACNAHCPDEKHVILQKNSPLTVSLLKKHGFIPIEVDTSEFIKSGGSVYCMKLMFF